MCLVIRPSGLPQAAEQHPTRIGAAGFPPPGDDELLTLRQGRVLMQQVRMVGWLQRSGAVAMRRASLCDTIGLSAGLSCPLAIGIALHYLSIDNDDVLAVPENDFEALVQSLQETCANGAVTAMFVGLVLSVVTLVAHVLERCAPIFLQLLI